MTFLVFVGSEGVDDVAEEDLGGYSLKEDVEVVIGEGDSLLSELFDRIFMAMKEGERAYIKTKVDAKCRKVDDSLPGLKSTLKFNVLLKSFNRAADIGELEPDEKLERAEHHKEKGTLIYQQNNIDFGLRRFRKALEYLNSISSVDGFSNAMVSRMNTLKCHCNLNLAAGHLKQEEFEKVIDYCMVALTLEPNNVKGLFRRAQAYAKLHQYDEAKKDLLRARELDAENKSIVSLLKNIELSMKKERQMYQKMFSH